MRTTHVDSHSRSAKLACCSDILVRTGGVEASHEIRPSSPKKSRRARTPWCTRVFEHIGLLAGEPPGTAELPFV